MANEPYEILVSPYAVWLNTMYTSAGADDFPDVETNPAGSWILMGSSGTRNIAEGGVTVEHAQEFAEIRTEGHYGPVKLVRTSESQKVRFTLLDLVPSQFTHALAGDIKTANSATLESIPLSRGENVREVKLLIRGASPLADGKKAQFEIPRAVQTGNPSLVFQKSAPVGLEFEFTCLDDTTSSTTGRRFGRFIAAI